MALAAVPTAEVAAGFLEDDREGAAVPDVHNGVEHGFGAAGGDAQVAVSVAPAARGVGGRVDPLPGFAAALLGHIALVGVAGEGPVHTGDLGNAGAAAIPPGAQSLGGAEHFVGAGIVGRADLDLAVDLEADQDAVERNAAQEGFGAVDRVDDPAESGCGSGF